MSLSAKYVIDRRRPGWLSEITCGKPPPSASLGMLREIYFLYKPNPVEEP